jgi:hypothetical protein
MSAHPAGCACVECEDRARAAQFWLQLVALWGSEEVDGYNEGGKNGLISRVGALVEEWQRFKVPSLQGLSATESQQIVDFVKARVAGEVYMVKVPAGPVDNGNAVRLHVEGLERALAECAAAGGDARAWAAGVAEGFASKLDAFAKENWRERSADPSGPVVHLLMGGVAACGLGLPGDWPPGHVWASFERPNDANCAQCLKLVNG